MPILKVGEMEIGDYEGLTVRDLMNDVRGICYGLLNLAPPHTQKFRRRETSPIFPLQLVGTFRHSHDASRWSFSK